MANLEDLNGRSATRGEAFVRRIDEATAAGGIAWSVPNQITVLRILLTPLFIAFLVYGMRVPALIIFCVSGVTDALDGMIARRYHQETALGSILDPLADKILLVASFWVLTTMGLIPTWVTILVVSRDALIVGGALYLRVFQEESAMPPSVMGKITTCVQLATVFWVLLFYFIYGREALYLDPFLMAAGILTFMSGFQYLFGFMRRVRESS